MLSLLPKIDLNCFQSDYLTCQNVFKPTLNQWADSLIIEQVAYPHPLTEPNNEALFCDVAFLGQTPTPSTVLVLISGTHGVEGFTGSAIQTDCLPLLSKVLRTEPGFGIVLIHALNPWGFAWCRRTDYEGIDLNRNFIDFSQPLPVNKEYEASQSVFTDASWLIQSNFSDLWAGSDFTAFVERMTRGQYQDAAGLFYGGRQPSWSRQDLTGRSSYMGTMPIPPI